MLFKKSFIKSYKKAPIFTTTKTILTAVLGFFLLENSIAKLGLIDGMKGDHIYG